MINSRIIRVAKDFDEALVELTKKNKLTKIKNTKLIARLLRNGININNKKVFIDDEIRL